MSDLIRRLDDEVVVELTEKANLVRGLFDFNLADVAGWDCEELGKDHESDSSVTNRDKCLELLGGHMKSLKSSSARL